MSEENGLFEMELTILRRAYKINLPMNTSDDAKQDWELTFGQVGEYAFEDYRYQQANPDKEVLGYIDDRPVYVMKE